MNLISRFLLLGVWTLSASMCSSQALNQVIQDANGNRQLLGKCSIEAFQDSPFQEWYAPNYQAYEPQNDLIERCEGLTEDLKVQVFLGTWCGDSKREVPRFMKVADQLGLSEEQIEFIAVSRADTFYKKSPTDEQIGKLIHRVPSFLFYKEEKEIGRIVEFPVSSMEMDLAQILHGLPSDPNYKIVHLLDQQLKEKYISSDSSQVILHIARALYKQGMHNKELNTYGYYLMANHRLNDAIIAFRINAMLYPDIPNVYDSLGEAYLRAEKYEYAHHMYSKCLELEPDNQNALAQIAFLQDKISPQ